MQHNKIAIKMSWDYVLSLLGPALEKNGIDPLMTKNVDLIVADASRQTMTITITHPNGSSVPEMGEVPETILFMSRNE